MGIKDDEVAARDKGWEVRQVVNRIETNSKSPSLPERNNNSISFVSFNAAEKVRLPYSYTHPHDAPRVGLQ